MANLPVRAYPPRTTTVAAARRRPSRALETRRPANIATRHQSAHRAAPARRVDARKLARGFFISALIGTAVVAAAGIALMALTPQSRFGTGLVLIVSAGLSASVAGCLYGINLLRQIIPAPEESR